MKVKYLLDEGAWAPRKAHEYDAGYDLMVKEGNKLIIPEQGSIVVDTGVHMNIPKYYRGSVVGRSGLNFKNSIICPTGTIDSGYTGSIMVKLYNLGDSPYILNGGDRIAQLVISPIADVELDRIGRLENTERGDGGFGSTGR